MDGGYSRRILRRKTDGFHLNTQKEFNVRIIYRSAYCGVNRAPYKFGRSIDTKPNDVENGASYIEIDTGRVYRYDKENKLL